MSDQLPEHWKLVQLKEIGTITIGLTYSPDDVVTEEGMLVLRSSNIQENRIDLTNQVRVKKKIPKNLITKEGDILICARNGSKALIGKSALIDKQSANHSFGTFMSVFRTKYYPFVFQLFQTDLYKNQIKINLGATINQITTGNLETFTFPFPPVEEQQKMTAILGTVDEKTDVINAQISQMQELKKGLLQQLLTKGIGHTQFKNSPVGIIPDSWQVVPLSTIATFANGKGHEQHIDANGKYIVVNSKFIATDGSVQKFSNRNLYPLMKGDIAMVMSDVPNGNAIAKCFIIDENDKYTLNQRVCSIKVNAGINTRFIYYVLNKNPYYLAFDNGVGQTNLRKEAITSCPIQLPPIEEQNKIATILTTLDEKLASLEQRKATTRELKKGLLQQLLTGKLSVAIK